MENCFAWKSNKSLQCHKQKALILSALSFFKKSSYTETTQPPATPRKRPHNSLLKSSLFPKKYAFQFHRLHRLRNTPQTRKRQNLDT